MDQKIYCTYKELRDPYTLVENPKNPNRHPEKQIALLANIIRAQGFRNPIVVSNRSGYVIKGHGRLAAAKLLGLKEVPVDLQDYETEASEWADMIADNKIAELAYHDQELLKSMMVELTPLIDLDLLGIPEDDRKMLMADWTVNSAKVENTPPIDSGVEGLIKVKCPMELKEGLKSFLEKCISDSHFHGVEID